MDHTHDDKFFGTCGRCGRWLLVTLGILLSLFLLAKTIHSFKQASLEGKKDYPANVITVRGTGEEFGIPNTAEFNYSVVERAKTVPEAQRLAEAKSAKVLAFLKENGIEEKDIKTISLNVHPTYPPCTQFTCSQTISGYEVSQTISVKVRKSDDAGEVLSGVGALGVSNVSGLSFTVEDDEALKASARAKAIADAKEKAEVLANDLDVKLVRIVNFYEDGGPIMPYYSKDATMGMGGANLAREQAASMPLPAGENQYTSWVTITYEIR